MYMAPGNAHDDMKGSTDASDNQKWLSVAHRRNLCNRV